MEVIFGPHVLLARSPHVELKYNGSGGGSAINKPKLDRCHRDYQHLLGPHERSNTSTTLKHPRKLSSGLPHGSGKPSIEALDAKRSPMLPSFRLLGSRLAATTSRSTGEVRSQGIECLRESLTERSRFPGRLDNTVQAHSFQHENAVTTRLFLPSLSHISCLTRSTMPQTNVNPLGVTIISGLKYPFGSFDRHPGRLRTKTLALGILDRNEPSGLGSNLSVTALTERRITLRRYLKWCQDG